MAGDNENSQSDRVKKTGFFSLILVAVVSIAAGLATPVVATVFTSRHVPPVDKAKTLHDEGPPAYIPFEDVTVNLDSSTLTRFLHVKIALQVRESSLKDVEGDITAKRQVLKDWLLSYLRDQNLEEIRGAAGHNRLRRHICEQINAMLYQGEYEKIENVLFEEFNVQ